VVSGGVGTENERRPGRLLRLRIVGSARFGVYSEVGFIVKSLRVDYLVDPETIEFWCGPYVEIPRAHLVAVPEDRFPFRIIPRRSDVSR